jgi:predicted nucleic acid-binding protein
MLLLDTDHVVEYQKGTSAEARRLKERLDRAVESFGTTIITVEEIMRGWMAAIHRLRDPRDQIGADVRLRQFFRFFAA